MSEKKVVILLIGNIVLDGRVQKEIKSIKKLNHEIFLIQWQYFGPQNLPASLGVNFINYPIKLSKSAFKNFLSKILFNFFALNQIRRIKPHYVHCNDLNTLIAGAMYHRKAKIIYDVHELFPETQKGIRKIPWTIIEKLLVHKSWRYILPEAHRLRYYTGKYSIRKNKTILLENFPMSHSGFPGGNKLRDKFGLGSDCRIILYTGMLSAGRNIEDVIQALELLPEKYVLILLGPTFRGYEKTIDRMAEAPALKNRFFIHPIINNEEMLEYISYSDIGVVFYKNTNLNNYYCASNKLYDFILCRKLIITNDHPGLIEVIQKNKLGFCLHTISSKTIAEAVLASENIQIKHNYSSPYIWENQEDRLLSLYS